MKIKTSESNHYEIIIPKYAMIDTYTLFPLGLTDGDIIAYLMWVGGDIMQPAIQSKDGVNFSLSFDGMVYNSGVSSPLHYPAAGDIQDCTPDKNYFFKNSDIGAPSERSAVNKNNASFRMDNVSVFRQDYSEGVMLNMRCSFEGSIEDGRNGSVVILATYDPIMAENA